MRRAAAVLVMAVASYLAWDSWHSITTKIVWLVVFMAAYQFGFRGTDPRKFQLAMLNVRLCARLAMLAWFVYEVLRPAGWWTLTQ